MLLPASDPHAQARVQRVPDTACRTDAYMGRCFPELHEHMGDENRSGFGYNWTHPGSKLDRPFRWMSAGESGANPLGVFSAHPASYRSYPSGGFISVVMPFFSTTWLPEERGLASDITDFRAVRATRTNKLEPSYFCVRISWDTAWVHQLCDPNDANGRVTGVVRLAIEEFWNDLKRAHYIDSATRAIQLTVPILSNSVGVRFSIRMMFELSSTGAVLPSYDVLSRVERSDLLASLSLYTWAAFGFTCFFCVAEGVELLSLGLAGYFSDMWNVMDWVNYAVFFLVWWQIFLFLQQVSDVPCTTLCETVGYVDDFEIMSTMRNVKKFLSICVCIQLLKVGRHMRTYGMHMACGRASIHPSIHPIRFLRGAAPTLTSALAFVSSRGRSSSLPRPWCPRCRWRRRCSRRRSPT